MTHDDDTRDPQPSASAPPKPPVPPPSPRPQLPERDLSPPPPSPGSARRDDELYPWLAALLSVIPCLGHLYARAPGRALALFLSWIVAITMLPFGLNIAAAFFLWFFGIFDSYREAQLANLDEPDAARSARGTGGLALGVFLTLTGGLLLAHHVYGLSLDWLREWWPVVVIAGGVYLIIDWLLARLRTPADDLPADELDEL
jgi:hypothetical protein